MCIKFITASSASVTSSSVTSPLVTSSPASSGSKTGKLI